MNNKIRITYYGKELTKFNRLSKIVLPMSNIKTVKESSLKSNVMITLDENIKTVLLDLEAILKYFNEEDIVIMDRNRQKTILNQRALTKMKKDFNYVENFVYQNLQNKDFDSINYYLLNVAYVALTDSHYIEEETDFIYCSFTNVLNKLYIDKADIECLLYTTDIIKNCRDTKVSDNYFKLLITEYSQKNKAKSKK